MKLRGGKLAYASRAVWAGGAARRWILKEADFTLFHSAGSLIRSPLCRQLPAPMPKHRWAHSSRWPSQAGMTLPSRTPCEGASAVQALQSRCLYLSVVTSCASELRILQHILFLFGVSYAAEFAVLLAIGAGGQAVVACRSSGLLAGWPAGLCGRAMGDITGCQPCLFRLLVSDSHSPHPTAALLRRCRRCTSPPLSPPLFACTPQMGTAGC